MSEESRPLLALGAPEAGERFKRRPPAMPRLARVSAARQGERLTPQFRALAEAFDARRAQLTDGQGGELDPDLVLVFDLAGTVEAFRNAINRIDGLEFLSEFLDESSEPDDDFYMVSQGARTDGDVQHSLQLVMSNSTAVAQLVTLFEQWQQDPEIAFAHGLGKFKTAFQQLRAIRRWGPADRIRETGLLESWRESVALVGQSLSSVGVEIELWFRQDAEQRRSAEAHLTEIVLESGGRVISRSEIEDISYHALLVELPRQQVEAVFANGAATIGLLAADEVMFVSPYLPMSVSAPPVDNDSSVVVPPATRPAESPRIALLDGLPFANHDALADRLVIDDPDGLADTYPAGSRHHGTAMASLILHGDLSSPGEPLSRPLYVRPILQPHPLNSRSEIAAQGQLLVDVIHRAVRRIVEGEGQRAAAAPSVRIINLSIGTETRALVRRISPLGRLLDWLSFEFNLLFVVSAGNHSMLPITIAASDAVSLESAREAVLRAVHSNALHRGILPPGDAMNAVTVGALHDDGAGELSVPDGIWDLVDPGAPALYSAIGPGVGRSVKPDLLHAGGRVLYVQPSVGKESGNLTLTEAPTTATGPGTQVAAPGSGGRRNNVAFTHGTSNATALVTREASQIFDILEAGRDDEADPAFPDAQYHPVLAKALLIHTSTWGGHGARLGDVLHLDNKRARRQLTSMLGYGGIRSDRIASAAGNRAVLIAGGSLGREQRHSYEVPLPPSLRAKAEWHRFTVTLAALAPTSGLLNRYRGAKVFFERLDDADTGGHRIEADHYMVRRGSVQHEIIDGDRALVFSEGGALKIHVECMDDAQRLRSGRFIRYGLVVSVETAVATSNTVHDEIRAQLRSSIQASLRTRV